MERLPLTGVEDVPYAAAMDSLSHLFALSKAYAASSGLAESTISERVLKGGNRLRDLREDKTDIGIRRLGQAIQWFSDHWPDGAVWPADVPRPGPTLADPPPDFSRVASSLHPATPKTGEAA